MKRMSPLLRTKLTLLAGALLGCGASLGQAAPMIAAPASAATQQVQPAPAPEAIRVAWDRVGTTA